MLVPTSCLVFDMAGSASCWCFEMSGVKVLMRNSLRRRRDERSGLKALLHEDQLPPPLVFLALIFILLPGTIRFAETFLETSAGT